jgi:hypothetical protein
MLIEFDCRNRRIALIQHDYLCHLRRESLDIAHYSWPRFLPRPRCRPCCCSCCCCPRAIPSSAVSSCESSTPNDDRIRRTDCFPPPTAIWGCWTRAIWSLNPWGWKWRREKDLCVSQLSYKVDTREVTCILELNHVNRPQGLKAFLDLVVNTLRVAP